jgi:GT2 family glycosyltransferase
MTDQPRVFLGNISRGEVRVELVASLFAVVGTQVHRTFFHQHGPYLDAARNMVVEKFLESDCDHLLFVDSDIEFTASDVDAVSRSVREADDRAVVGGWYLNPVGDGVKPVVYDYKPDSGFRQWGLADIDDVAYVGSMVEDPTHVVGALGAGFLCIPRLILDDMKKYYEFPTPWFAEVGLNGVHLGEDLTFALRVDALGYPVLLRPDVKVTHYKTTRL